MTGFTVFPHNVNSLNVYSFNCGMGPMLLLVIYLLFSEVQNSLSIFKARQ